MSVSSSSLNAALREYERKVRSGVPSSEGALPGDDLVSEEIAVKEVVLADTEGNTFAYLITEEDRVYKIAVAADELVVTVRAGDTVRVEYEAADGQLAVVPIVSFEKAG